METIRTAFIESLVDVWSLFTNVVLNIIIASLLLAAGVYISVLISGLIRKVIYFLKVDSLVEKTSFFNFFFQRGIRCSISGFVYWLIKWTGILLSFHLFLSILNLDSVTVYLKSLSGFSIKAISAVAILFFGFYIANFLNDLILFIGQIFSLKSAAFISGFIKIALIIFSLVFALVELQISEQILKTFLTAILAFLVIAGGIAFGYAGKDYASSLIKNIFHGLIEKKEEIQDEV